MLKHCLSYFAQTIPGHHIEKNRFGQFQNLRTQFSLKFRNSSYTNFIKLILKLTQFRLMWF